MEKGKEWLKDLINEEGIVMDMNLLGRLDEQYWKNENIKINKGRLFYLIDQLDEPEIEQSDKKTRELESYNDELIRDNNQLRNTLDNQEVLSEEWIDEHAQGGCDEWVYIEDLQNLLVPKQGEVDQAYKDGYEKGKKYTFYKGYLEGLADKESEPETVADVLADFHKSLERFKKVLGTKVEELEE